MGNLIQTKIKTNISPKVAVGTLLVVVGVAFGAVAFNGLVPTFFTPSNDATSIAATVEPTGWTSVLDYQQCNETSVKNLILAIQAGADVKILNINNSFQQQCTAVEVKPGSSTGTSDIYCYLSGKKNVLLAGPSVVEDLSVIIVNTSKPCKTRWVYSDDRITSAGTHEFITGNDYGVQPTSWFVKK